MQGDLLLDRRPWKTPFGSYIQHLNRCILSCVLKLASHLFEGHASRSDFQFQSPFETRTGEFLHIVGIALVIWYHAHAVVKSSLRAVNSLAIESWSFTNLFSKYAYALWYCAKVQNKHAWVSLQAALHASHSHPSYYCSNEDSCGPCLFLSLFLWKHLHAIVTYMYMHTIQSKP